MSYKSLGSRLKSSACALGLSAILSPMAALAGDCVEPSGTDFAKVKAATSDLFACRFPQAASMDPGAFRSAVDRGFDRASFDAAAPSARGRVLASQKAKALGVLQGAMRRQLDLFQGTLADADGYRAELDRVLAESGGAPPQPGAHPRPPAPGPDAEREYARLFQSSGGPIPSPSPLPTPAAPAAADPRPSTPVDFSGMFKLSTLFNLGMLGFSLYSRMSGEGGDDLSSNTMTSDMATMGALTLAAFGLYKYGGRYGAIAGIGLNALMGLLHLRAGRKSERYKKELEEEEHLESEYPEAFATQAIARPNRP